LVALNWILVLSNFGQGISVFSTYDAVYLLCKRFTLLSLFGT
jgi:hypothetical protein